MRAAVSLVNACLMPAYAGRTPPEWILRALDQGLAGVGLFGTNFPAASGSVREEIADPLRAVRPDLLIALDEEGGDVTRLDYHRGSVYPGNHALGAVDDPALTLRVNAAIARDLLAAGVNLCLAPCADVNSRPDNPIIGVRSFGDRPDVVARHTAAAVRGLQEYGVAATLKHFPGHGDTRTDSHSALPDIPRDLAALSAVELPPFAAGIAAGAKVVMTGHIRLGLLDDLPATLSRRVVTGLLREELGHEGVVMTDALEMAPIVDRWGYGGAAVAALAAGTDLVLLGATDGEELLPQIHEAVAAALRDGTLSADRLEEAAARVAALRAWADPTGRPVPGRLPVPGRTGAAKDMDADVDAVGLVAARRALLAHALPPATGRPVHTVRLAAHVNLAVGEAPWGPAAALKDLDALASALDVAHGTDAADIPLPSGGPLAVVVRDAARDPWQLATLEALRARRPDLITVEMGLGLPLPPDAPPTLLTRGAGLANATAAAELLAGRDRSGRSGRSGRPRVRGVAS
ncbi:glycoside hydrolase family 3 N-terminal domain-containing protein [Streptomyces sp. NPDC003077]|uniref:glycoside hydrolase family 3 protein n=1 Tax=Streptomyces sp. NPDC003077 TaxID=3154443 RepID=UPI0033B48971